MLNISAVIATVLLVVLVIISKERQQLNKTTTTNPTKSKLKNNMVSQIQSADEFNQSIKADKLVVVDFFSTTCGPCKMIAPIFEKFAAQYTEADFYKVDCDEVSAVASATNITSLPTFVLYKNGEEITRILGANPAGLKSAIAANL